MYEYHLNAVDHLGCCSLRVNYKERRTFILHILNTNRDFSFIVELTENHPTVYVVFYRITVDIYVYIKYWWISLNSLTRTSLARDKITFGGECRIIVRLGIKCQMKGGLLCYHAGSDALRTAL